MTPGMPFPSITVSTLSGAVLDISKPVAPHDWKMIVVYRGKHCPICTRYLAELNSALPKFNELGVDVVAVSADPEEKAAAQMALVNPAFAVGYGLSVDQMRQMGLFVSAPMSPKETDRPFAEPGVFVINSEGALQVLDISNAPFARPDLGALLMGLTYIRNPANAYPVRGTHSESTRAS